MTTLFVVGAPTSALAAWAQELAARPDVALIHWNVGATLERLREATEHRAMVWQGLAATKPAWAARAVERFGPELLARLAERVPKRAPVFGTVHAENARRVETLAAAFPQAHFLHVLRDGAVPIVAGNTAVGEWAAHVEPLARVESALGARLITVRAEDTHADGDAQLARVVDALALGAPRAWTTKPPVPEARLAGLDLQVFLAHGPTRRMLAHFGYAAPEPDASVEHSPLGTALWAQQLLEAQRLDEAELLLARAIRRGDTAALAEALGDLRLRQGRERDAVLAWVRAIQLDDSRASAWSKLFGQAERPETEKLAEYARLAPHVEVRRAFARWLVARGLDREAAEIAAEVEHR